MKRTVKNRDYDAVTAVDSLCPECYDTIVAYKQGWKLRVLRQKENGNFHFNFLTAMIEAEPAEYQDLRDAVQVMLEEGYRVFSFSDNIELGEFIKDPEGAASRIV